RQIWKMTSQGGDAFQLTREGGFVGFESSDGRFIYYAKTAADPDIWKLQLQDRQEAAVSPQIHVSQGTRWAPLIMASFSGGMGVRAMLAGDSLILWRAVWRTSVRWTSSPGPSGFPHRLMRRLFFMSRST